MARGVAIQAPTQSVIAQERYFCIYIAGYQCGRVEVHFSSPRRVVRLQGRGGAHLYLRVRAGVRPRVYVRVGDG